MTRVNDQDDLENVILNPDTERPNFYYYPDDKRISVSRCGVIFNNKTNKILTQRKHKSGRLQVAITSPGKEFKLYKVHRILARTFLGRPSRHLDKKFSELEVNHIDGNVLNNNLSNLEWVTKVENLRHYFQNWGKFKGSPVLAKNIYTHRILNFFSIRECAAYFNIHHATLWKHLIKGNSGRFHKDDFVFKFDDGSTWKEYQLKTIRPIGDPIEACVVHVTDKENNTDIVVNGYLNVSRFVGTSVATIFRHLTKLGFFENARYVVKALNKNINDSF